MASVERESTDEPQPMTRPRQKEGGMPEEAPNTRNAPKPAKPTEVREPDNTRAPDSPTPTKPMQPPSAVKQGAPQAPREEMDEPETEGM